MLRRQRTWDRHLANPRVRSGEPPLKWMSRTHGRLIGQAEADRFPIRSKGVS